MLVVRFTKEMSKIAFYWVDLQVNALDICTLLKIPIYCVNDSYMYHFHMMYVNKAIQKQC